MRQDGRPHDELEDIHVDESSRPGAGPGRPGGPTGPASVPGLSPSAPTGGGPVAERMQALLSRAVEEQASEQRQVSAVLGDLRQQVAGLSDQLRGTASGDRVEQLAGDLGSLTIELRRATTGLGDRLDTVARRVEEQATAAAETAAAGSAGTEAMAVRLGALGADVAAQGTALERVTSALEALASFPDALASVQGGLAGLHDRLAPLGEIRAGLADLSARTSGVEALRPELGAVADKVASLATAADVTRARDSLVVAVGDRLERLERLANRPALERQDLDELLSPVRQRLDELAEGGPVVERLRAVDSRLADLQQRLGELGDRVSDIGDAAGGVPSVATDVALVANRLDALGPLREEVAGLASAVAEIREDPATPQLLVGLTSLRDDVEVLAGRVDAVEVPSVDAVANAVSGKVGDRIVDALAPRVAEVVLTRVAAVLVEQVASTVTASVQHGLTERVRAATAESERRMSAHVDEAILALAEALLRRRRPARQAPPADAPAEELTTAVPLPGVERVQDPPAVPSPDRAPAAAGDAVPAEPLAPAEQAAGTAEREPSADGSAAAGEPAAAHEDPARQPTGDDTAAAVDGAGADGQRPGAEPAEPAPAEPGASAPAAGDAVEDADEQHRGDEDRLGEQADAGLAAVGGEPEPAAVELGEQPDQPDGRGEPVAAEVAAPDRADSDRAAGMGEGDGAEQVDDADDRAGADLRPEDIAPEDLAPEDLAPEDLAPEDLAPEPAEPADAPPTEPAQDEATPSGPPPDAGRTTEPDRSDATSSDSERTGALALRSGLRGLGLDVDDPVLEDDRPVPEVPVRRPAPPARPRVPVRAADAPTADAPPEPVRTAPPVAPRPDVQQRYAAAANSFRIAGAPERDDEADDADDRDDSPRRRPWWRPGG